MTRTVIIDKYVRFWLDVINGKLCNEPFFSTSWTVISLQLSSFRENFGELWLCVCIVYAIFSYEQTEFHPVIVV